MWVAYIAGVIYLLALVFVFAFSVMQAHLLYHFLRRKSKPQTAPRLSDSEMPRVTVQLPLYNEQYVASRLIAAVAALNYPKEKLEIQILDDSTDETSELVQECMKHFDNVSFSYITRRDRSGFKAGALKNGLAQSGGELVAIFDADFVPDPNFLLQTIPHFTDPDVGMVQSRWGHLNEDFSTLTRLQAFALDAHFTIEQVGRNVQGAYINFNGTAGIWRKACILDAGNWEADTLTEDLDLSYRAQQKGWKFVFRPDIVSPAELPPVMPAIKSQQFRWTKGGAECAKKHLSTVWKSGVGMRVKLHATAHLLNAVIFPAILCLALASLGVWWAFYCSLFSQGWVQASSIFLVSFAVIAAVYLVGHASIHRVSIKQVICYLWTLPLFLSVSMGLSLHNSLAVCEGFSGRKSPFIRTPKYNLLSEKSDWRFNRYHLSSLGAITYLEGLLALVFSGMVIASIVMGVYPLLAFHTMLATGFGIVFFGSVIHSWKS